MSIRAKLARTARDSLAFRLVSPILDIRRLLLALPGYVRFARDLREYRRLPGAERLRIRDLSPQLHDRRPTTSYDPHYFFQDVWAASRIAERRPDRHVD